MRRLGSALHVAITPRDKPVMKAKKCDPETLEMAMDSMASYTTDTMQIIMPNGAIVWAEFHTSGIEDEASAVLTQLVNSIEAM